MTYTITARERDGHLWITIPAAIRRHLGLQAGDTARWRKQRGENAFIIKFFRRGRKLLPWPMQAGDELGALPGVVKATRRLRGERGRLHADRITEVFGYTRAKLGKLIHISPKQLLATPEAESLQDALEPFEQITRMLVLNDDEASFRKWLNAPNAEFDGRTPNDVIGQQGPQIVADLVRDILTHRGG